MRRIALQLALVLFGLAPVAVGQAQGADVLIRKDAPTVSMTYPPRNAVFATQLSPVITFEATVSDPDEAIGGVAFLVCPVGGTSCGTMVVATGPNPYVATWTPPPPLILSPSGESTAYLVQATAYNALGQAQYSTAVPFTVLQPPTYPRIDLIVPDQDLGNLGLEFVTPASPVLYATTIADTRIVPSSIVRVDFLDGSTVIGTLTAPNTIPGGYAFVWANASPGAHLISARAVDSTGGSASSNAVAVYIVDPDQPPSVALTAPATGQIFTRSSVIPLSATASSSQGAVERVDFKAGTTVIASVFSPPFTSSWVHPPSGHFTITASAYDDLGIATTSSAAHVEVLPTPRLPSVVLTAPAPGTAIAAGIALPLAAAALAPDGSISRVDFLAGTSVIGSAASAPYTYNWTNPTVGTLSLTAKAYDLQGHSGISTPVSVSVISSTPPAVALTSPAGGAAFAAPGSVGMTASATPATGASIAKVEFLANGSVVGTRNAAPFSFAWSGVAAGSYALTARATDNLGNASTSAPVSISVRTDVPPSVTLTAPGNGQTFYVGQAIGLSATASDSDGTVTRLEFLIDGAVVASLGAAPYAYTWTGASVGTHAVAARATDNLGVATTSAAATITVAANSPPSVSLTAPINQQTFSAGQSIALAASASDSDGSIAKVEFLVDSSVIGTKTASPYTMSWSGAAIGTHILAARATDNQGAPTTSAAISIVVNASSAPTVSLAMPRANQIFAAGATIHLAAKAADAGATIARVEFYAGSTLIGTVTAPPYNFAWAGVSAGSYVLTAKVIDSQTASATSSGVPVQVITPTLTITSPAPNASIAADFVLVTGTYQGPPNSGVTVNGVVANNDGQGNYFVNNVPLVTGQNTLTVALTTPDGQTAVQTQTVTSTSTAPLRIYAEPDAAVGSGTFVIRLENRTANAYTEVLYQNLGGGQLDSSALDQSTLGKIAYTAPGSYTPRFSVTDSAGNTYTQSLELLVHDRATLDAMLKSAWTDLTSALSAGDKSSAMRVLSSPARVKYGPVFDELAPYMAQIIPDWSPPMTGTLSSEIGEFAIRRVLGGMKQVFFVYFVRDGYGIWRLGSM